MHEDELVEIVRRNARTPSFLVRFFPLDRGELDDSAMRAAFDSPDQSGLTLRTLLHQFLSFLVIRCERKQREDYRSAPNPHPQLAKLHPGT